MERQAGFTLIETLVGAAIGVVMIWGLLVLADRMVASASAAGLRVNGSANAARLIERLSSEAASAWAVYVPATDVLGQSNSDGHELDFLSEDGAHRVYAWAYTFDAATKTLTRYAVVPGGTPVAGDVIADIDTLRATPASVTSLGASSSTAYDPLFASANAVDVPYTFAAMPSAVGGNRLVAVQIVASGVNRSVLLASEDAPTTFTVVVNYTPSPAPVVTATPAPPAMY
jgi:prepilin-type N-terminal cleavage/methylation domain-containing protein